MFRQTTSVQPTIIVAILVIVSIVGYYVFFSQIKEHNTETMELISEIEFTKQREQQLRNMKSTARETETDRTKLSTYFIKEESIVDFLEIIESFEEYTGAKVRVRTIGKNDPGVYDTLEQLRLNLTVDGSWDEVYHFLVLIEALPYRVVVESIQLTASARQEDSNSKWQGVTTLTVVKEK